jgi:integrase/recombinase XerC
LALVSDRRFALDAQAAPTGRRKSAIKVTPVGVLVDYLTSPATRTRATTKRRAPASGPAAWPTTAPLFVGGDGEPINRDTLQSWVLRAFKKAGLNGQRPRAALIHTLRHTCATELSVYTLTKIARPRIDDDRTALPRLAGTENRCTASSNSRRNRSSCGFSSRGLGPAV